MWSTSSRSAHKQWVKYHREGGIVKTPQELRAHLGAKACTNGTVKLPLLSTPSQTAKIKLCNTILITHFYNFEVLHSIKTKLKFASVTTQPSPLSLQLTFSHARQANSVWSALRNHTARVTWKYPGDFQPTGSSRHRYLRIPAILFSATKTTPHQD